MVDLPYPGGDSIRIVSGLFWKLSFITTRATCNRQNATCKDEQATCNGGVSERQYKLRHSDVRNHAAHTRTKRSMQRSHAPQPCNAACFGVQEALDVADDLVFLRHDVIVL
jgi:hypothetical protein